MTAHSSPDTDDLGLIHLADLDEVDGGLEAGLHELFPRPPGHVGRAEQARREWQAAADAAALETFDAAALAPATRAKYDHAWAEFGGFCLGRGVGDPLDAGVDDIRRWIHAMTAGGYRPSTRSVLLACSSATVRYPIA